MAKRPAKNVHIGGEQLPLITPTSAWEVPTSLPDLRGKIKQMAIDSEGRDEGIAAGRGAAWPYRGGHICGVSAAWREGGEIRSIYAPTRHPDTSCMDRDMVADWVRIHAQSGIQMVAHHGSHDWGWMRSEWGVRCPTSMRDTEAQAMLVDENRLTYRLDDLCRWKGIPGKDERALREAAAAYGFSGDVKGNLWRMPARYVGPYAEQDSASTLLLSEAFQMDIEREGLEGALQLEMDLMPMVLEMRMRGIRVNLDYAHMKKVQLLEERDRVLVELGQHLGQRVSIEHCRSAKTLEAWFTSERIPFQRTEKNNQGSFQAGWMRKHPHWLPRLVARAEQLTDAADKFLQGMLIDYAHKGRIHAVINQYRGEDGGTRSFRFSYADPALQQAPNRDAEMSEAFRGALEPEEGEIWDSADYSQQEYRLIVHFACLLNLPKAREAAQLYWDDPNTDFHNLVAEWTGLERKPAKDTNFAKAFGAGVPKFAQMIGQSIERAREIMTQYDTEMPFVPALGKECQKLADRRGWIRLLDGARSHFDMWEVSWRNEGEPYFAPRPHAQALQVWPDRRIRRAWTHKAMNRLIQGSAARQTKLWMRACWQEGLLPLLQMHDELCFSVTSRKQVERIAELGRDVVRLEVPMKIDSELGPNWGAAKQGVDEIWPLAA